MNDAASALTADKRYFSNTPWTLVDRLRDPETRKQALNELLPRYRGPILAYCEYMCKQLFVSQTEPEDLCQEFTAALYESDKLNALQGRERGKFRGWICKTLENFALNKTRKERRRKKRARELHSGIGYMDDVILQRNMPEFGLAAGQVVTVIELNGSSLKVEYAAPGSEDMNMVELHLGDVRPQDHRLQTARTSRMTSSIANIDDDGNVLIEPIHLDTAQVLFEKKWAHELNNAACQFMQERFANRREYAMLLERVGGATVASLSRKHGLTPSQVDTTLKNMKNELKSILQGLLSTEYENPTKNDLDSEGERFRELLAG